MATIARPAAASTATPAPREQSLSTFFHVEIMNDLDDGQPTLLIATEANLGDIRSSAPARARSTLAAERARLDAIEQMIDMYEAEDTIRAIVAKAGALLEEWDTSALEPRLRDNFIAAAMLTKDEQTVFVVPQGQNPIARAGALADLVNSLEKQAALA